MQFAAASQHVFSVFAHRNHELQFFFDVRFFCKAAHVIDISKLLKPEKARGIWTRLQDHGCSPHDVLLPVATSHQPLSLSSLGLGSWLGERHLMSSRIFPDGRPCPNHWASVSAQYWLAARKGAEAICRFMGPAGVPRLSIRGIDLSVDGAGDINVRALAPTSPPHSGEETPYGSVLLPRSTPC